MNSQDADNVWDLFYSGNENVPWDDGYPDRSLNYLLKKGFIKGKEILDAGCGNGKNSFFLHRLGFDVTGIDISGKAINIAGRNKGIRFHVGSTLNMKYKSGSFDTVIDYGCMHSLHPHEKKHLENIFRILKKDGAYILRVFSDKHPLKESYEIFRKLNISFYSKSEIKGIIRPFFDIVFFDNDIEGVGNDSRTIKNPNFHLLVLRPKKKALKIFNFKIPSFSIGVSKPERNVHLKASKCIHVNSSKDKKHYDRLYFGNEFCPNIVPKIFSLDRDYFSKYTLLTPFMTEDSLVPWKHLITLFSKKFPGSEVVFNDWSLLYHINSVGLMPVLGRLLVRQKCDPRTIRLISKIPKKGYEYFKGCAISSIDFRKFLLDNNVHRAELSNVLQGIDIKQDNHKIRLSLHMPFVPVTVTRACLIAGADKLINRKNTGITVCNKECDLYEMVLDESTMPVKLYMKGNMQYYINDKLPVENPDIDRLVYY